MNKDQIINNRYKILSELGKGGFGQVYKVQDISKNQDLAMKIELFHRGSISQEIKILQDLQNGEGITKLHDSGKFNTFTYMIIDLLGQNLSSMRKSLTTFSLNTVVLLLFECLNRIEYIHSKGYIHRDIKPQQFLIGPKDTVYLVDYGISKKYIIDGHHMSFQSQCERAGSSSYASVNSHIGIRLSRRDDLESWVYMGVFFVQGYLPWQQSKTINNNRKWQNVFTIKRNTKNEELFKHCPKMFSVMLEYVRSIRFEEKPNYEYLKKLLFDVKQQLNLPGNLYDWKMLDKGRSSRRDEDLGKNVQVTRRRSDKKKERINRRNKTMTPIVSKTGFLPNPSNSYLKIPGALSRTASHNSQDLDSSDCETIKMLLPGFSDRKNIFKILTEFRSEFAINKN